MLWQRRQLIWSKKMALGRKNYSRLDSRRTDLGLCSQCENEIMFQVACHPRSLVYLAFFRIDHLPLECLKVDFCDSISLHVGRGKEYIQYGKIKFDNTCSPHIMVMLVGHSGANHHCHLCDRTAIGGLIVNLARFDHAKGFCRFSSESRCFENSV